MPKSRMGHIMCPIFYAMIRAKIPTRVINSGESCLWYNIIKAGIRRINYVLQRINKQIQRIFTGR